MSDHDCAQCAECIHDGHKCCGCYDGACCQTLEAHTRTGTNLGPDYCAECSATLNDWVPWPCPATEREAGRSLST